ncbi:MAG TPA: hypothetical protein VIU38_14415 [Anaerolineales bacterium]
MLNKSIVLISVQLALMLAIVAVPAGAAPAAAGVGVTACSSAQAPTALGVDGGLTGLSRGEITIQSVAASSNRPLGVDDGLLSLMFARSSQATFVGSAGNACAGAFTRAGS